MNAPGFVLYDGPSQLDGERIVAILVTGKSSNRKTGNMVQTYILRPDVDPIAAVREGKDASICGDCKHRGDGTGKGRTCYVTLMHGPSVVYRTFSAGRYALATRNLEAEACRGRYVRLGTYGDPAAVPIAVWQNILQFAAGWTGYTHQWMRAPEFQPIVMASVDSPSEQDTAQSLGWRTFRVRGAMQPLRSEVACPASEEAGRKTQCASCGLCKGTSLIAKSVSILAHGSGRAHFQTA